MKLTDFKVLTFDCYGTLIDWESGMLAALEPLTATLAEKLEPDQVLQAHARHESDQQRLTPSMPYSELLSIVYKRLADEWGRSTTVQACEQYGQSVGNWPAFADSVEALKYLKNHYKLVILSNVDRKSFKLSQQRLEVEFDAVLTAEDVGTYKPSDRNFQCMIDHLESISLTKKDILHTAESLFHDHVPANRHKLASCWIYRRHNQEGYGATMDPGAMPRIDFKFNSMAELAQAHKASMARI